MVLGSGPHTPTQFFWEYPPPPPPHSCPRAFFIAEMIQLAEETKGTALVLAVQLVMFNSNFSSVVFRDGTIR